MKKLLVVLMIMFSALVFGQGGPTVDIIEFKNSVTTAIRNSFDVPAGKYWLVYNTDTDLLEIGDENENWVSVGSGIQEGQNSVDFLNINSGVNDNFIQIEGTGGVGDSSHRVYISGGTGSGDGTGIAFRAGELTTVGFSDADIDAAGNESLITKGWFLNNNTGGTSRDIRIVGSYTTTERDNLTTGGDETIIIYNSTTSQLEFIHDGGTWAPLVGSGGGTDYVDDSLADDTAALNSAISQGGVVRLKPNATYNITTELENTLPVSIIGDGTQTIESSTIFKMFEASNDLVLEGFEFKTTAVEPNEDLLGVFHSVRKSTIENGIVLRNMRFDVGGQANINAIKIDYGKEDAETLTSPRNLPSIVIDNVAVKNAGRMSLEIISHTKSDDANAFVGNVSIKDFRSKDSGQVNSLYGMGISISGNVHHTDVRNADIDGFKDIAFENRSGRHLNVDGLSIKNPSEQSDRAILNNTDKVDPYLENQNISYNNVDIVGDMILQINSEDRPILIDNMTAVGNIKFELKNINLNNSYIETDSIIQVLEDRLVRVTNSDIRLGTGSSWFDVKNTSSLSILDSEITKEDANQSIITDDGVNVNIDNSKFTNGYFNGNTGTRYNIVNSDFTNPGAFQGFAGTATYDVHYSYRDGVLISELTESLTVENGTNGRRTIINGAQLVFKEQDGTNRFGEFVGSGFSFKGGNLVVADGNELRSAFDQQLILNADGSGFVQSLDVIESDNGIRTSTGSGLNLFADNGTLVAISSLGPGGGGGWTGTATSDLDMANFDITNPTNITLEGSGVVNMNGSPSSNHGDITFEALSVASFPASTNKAATTYDSSTANGDNTVATFDNVFDAVEEKSFRVDRNAYAANSSGGAAFFSAKTKVYNDFTGTGNQVLNLLTSGIPDEHQGTFKKSGTGTLTINLDTGNFSGFVIDDTTGDYNPITAGQSLVLDPGESAVVFRIAGTNDFNVDTTGSAVGSSPPNLYNAPALVNESNYTAGAYGTAGTWQDGGSGNFGMTEDSDDPGLNCLTSIEWTRDQTSGSLFRSVNLTDYATRITGYDDTKTYRISMYVNNLNGTDIRMEAENQDSGDGEKVLSTASSGWELVTYDWSPSPGQSGGDIIIRGAYNQAVVFNVRFTEVKIEEL